MLVVWVFSWNLADFSGIFPVERGSTFIPGGLCGGLASTLSGNGVLCTVEARGPTTVVLGRG
jgi:hypothetical protein